MDRLIAFLRAVNVGGHTIKMDLLRTLFGELGFENVETFIASGNVIFDTAERDIEQLESQVEAHLQQHLGYPVTTFVRTPHQLGSIVNLGQPNNLGKDDASYNLYIGFLKHIPAEAAQQKLFALCTPNDEFTISGREYYWIRRGLMSESTVTGAMIEKALGMPSTMRNITTLCKLAAKTST